MARELTVVYTEVLKDRRMDEFTYDEGQDYRINAKEESIVIRVLATSKNAGFGHPTEQLTSTLQKG